MRTNREDMHRTALANIYVSETKIHYQEKDILFICASSKIEKVKKVK